MLGRCVGGIPGASLALQEEGSSKLVTRGHSPTSSLWDRNWKVGVPRDLLGGGPAPTSSASALLGPSSQSHLLPPHSPSWPAWEEALRGGPSQL